MTNHVGVDLNAVYAAVSTTTPEIPGLPHEPGDQVVAEDGSIWVFGTAGGTIVTNDTVALDAAHTDVEAILGGATAAHGHRGVAFCQNAGMTSGQSGWFMKSGAPTIRILDDAAVDVPLFTTDSAGVLAQDVATGSQFPIRGLYLISAVTSATASIQNANAIAQFPHLGGKSENDPAGNP
jgi:hypothetical protein